jgi:hypothetical protein
MAESNARAEIANALIANHRQQMLAAFRASSQPVVGDTKSDFPMTPSGPDWTDGEIEGVIRKYMYTNTVRNDRILEWYQHLATSGTVWTFPMKGAGQKLPPAWDASTSTPDIPWKKTVRAEIKGQNACWQRWLEGEYLVMSLDGSSPRDRETEPIGALKVSNHVLAIIAPGCSTAITPEGFELHCFGKVAKGGHIYGGPRILHYNPKSSGIGSPGGNPITTRSEYRDYWIGTTTG